MQSPFTERGNQMRLGQRKGVGSDEHRQHTIKKAMWHAWDWGWSLILKTCRGNTAGNEKPKDLRTLTPWKIIAELDLTSVKELRKK